MTVQSERNKSYRKVLEGMGMAPVTVWIPDTLIDRQRIRRVTEGLRDSHMVENRPTKRLKVRLQRMMGWKKLAYRKISRQHLCALLLSPYGISALYAFVNDTDKENSPDPALWVQVNEALRTGSELMLQHAAADLWELGATEDEKAHIKARTNPHGRGSRYADRFRYDRPEIER